MEKREILSLTDMEKREIFGNIYMEKREISNRRTLYV